MSGAQLHHHNGLHHPPLPQEEARRRVEREAAEANRLAMLERSFAKQAEREAERQAIKETMQSEVRAGWQAMRGRSMLEQGTEAARGPQGGSDTMTRCSMLSRALELCACMQHAASLALLAVPGLELIPLSLAPADRLVQPGCRQRALDPARAPREAPRAGGGGAAVRACAAALLLRCRGTGCWGGGGAGGVRAQVGQRAVGLPAGACCRGAGAWGMLTDETRAQQVLFRLPCLCAEGSAAGPLGLLHRRRSAFWERESGQGAKGVMNHEVYLKQVRVKELHSEGAAPRHYGNAGPGGVLSVQGLQGWIRRACVLQPCNADGRAQRKR